MTSTQQSENYEFQKYEDEELSYDIEDLFENLRTYVCDGYFLSFIRKIQNGTEDEKSFNKFITKNKALFIYTIDIVHKFLCHEDIKNNDYKNIFISNDEFNNFNFFVYWMVEYIDGYENLFIELPFYNEDDTMYRVNKNIQYSYTDYNSDSDTDSDSDSE